MNTFGRDFVRAYNPAYQQAADAATAQQQIRLQEALLAKRREDERNRAVADGLAKFNEKAAYSPDGSFDYVSNAAKLYKLTNDADVAQAAARALAATRASNAEELNLKAQKYNINTDPAQNPTRGQNGWSLGIAPAPTANDKGLPLANRVFNAEQNDKIDQVKREAVARAEAGAPYRERYVSRGPYEVGGKFVGDAVRDNVSGEIGVMQNGQLVPLPAGATPITATGLQKSVPDMKTFRGLKSAVTDAEISLKGLDRYLASQGDTNTGIARLADGFMADMKTIMGLGLKPEELALKMANGQLQGLLGANRTNVVGGGVMTEQDALRIIERLGGNVNAIQNPEIVRAAIQQLYSDRYKQYQDDVRFYNAAVDDYYGSKGFNSVKMADFNPLLQNDYAPASAPAAPAAAPANGGVKIKSIKQLP